MRLFISGFGHFLDFLENHSRKIKLKLLIVISYSVFKSFLICFIDGLVILCVPLKVFVEKEISVDDTEIVEQQQTSTFLTTWRTI